MKRRILVIFLFLISHSFMPGCISAHDSSSPQPTQLITPMNTPTSIQDHKNDDTMLHHISEYSQIDNGAIADDRFVGEWLGKTYSIVSVPTLENDQYGQYTIDYSKSIEMKITIYNDGSGWLSTVPFSDKRVDPALLNGAGTNLTIVDAHDGFLVLRWNGWEYNGAVTSALPHAGEIRVGYYSRIGSSPLSPIWETEVNWSAGYIPEYALVGDIVSMDDELLHRITFDDFSKCTSPPDDSGLYKSVMDEDITNIIEDGVSMDGNIQLVSASTSGEKANYQYLKYIDTKNQEHIYKFRLTQDECRLIDIDGTALLMEPVAFTYNKGVFFYYYWINLLELDRSTGALENAKTKSPLFYKSTFSALYNRAEQELADGWKEKYEGVEIAISKAYVFLLDHLLTGKFNGTTSDEISDYLNKHYTGPMPYYYDPSYYKYND